MQRHTALNKFGQADMLFQQGRFDESLSLLDELDQAFPNSPNIMYPRARCLVEIGETNEALDILEDLTSQFQHEEAVAMKREVQEAIATLTQPHPAEARHHDGPPPPKQKARMSSSRVESTPVVSKGNLTVITVTAVILLAVFVTIIVVALAR